MKFFFTKPLCCASDERTDLLNTMLTGHKHCCLFTFLFYSVSYFVPVIIPVGDESSSHILNLISGEGLNGV